MSSRCLAALLAGMFTFHLLLASQLPPAEDELYYWCWSRELQLSYYDHPPLCAYLVRLSTSVLGDTLLGVRFFACLGAVVVLGVVAQLADRRMLGWLLASPVFLFGSILLTPRHTLAGVLVALCPLASPDQPPPRR
jgi:4-amino-4-deoxy-L-arabinose transferase-like glycosyltransferase